MKKATSAALTSIHTLMAWMLQYTKYIG